MSFYACASVGKEIIPSGMFGTIRLQKGKYAVYTLKGSYAGLQELYNTINIDFNYTKRHGMAFEEYVSYSEEDDDTQVTKIYIPINKLVWKQNFAKAAVCRCKRMRS